MSPRWFLLTLLLALGFAVSSTRTAGCAEAGATPEQLITGFAGAPKPDAMFYAINQAAATNPAPLRKAALTHIGDGDATTRYAALYALALSADKGDGDALANFRDSPIADERLLAAGALTSLHDKRALPVLIAALDQDVPLEYRAPGERAYAFAQKQLLYFTNQDFGLNGARTAQQVAATKPAWVEWWRKVGPSLHFDLQSRRFVE